MNIRFVFLVLLCIVAAGKLSAQNNTGFENGLTGWHATGKAEIDKSNAYKGAACTRIASGSIYVRVPVASLAIIQFDCYIKSSQKGTAGYSFVRFFDKGHKQLLEYKNKEKDSLNYFQTGNYTEAPVNSTYMEIGIQKDSSGKGFIYADDFAIKANALPHSKVKHEPIVDLDQYMKPFWNSDTIYNETVLLYAANGKPADGKLLYTPDHILSVKSYDLKNKYAEGSDYTIAGNIITRSVASSMPFRTDTSFDTKKDLAWFNTEPQWVVVTYTHHNKWTGPVPQYKGNLLPNTLGKLNARKPLRIVAYGMSITRGMDVSGFDTIPPYMPTYVDLFARQLRKAYHDPDIKLYNAGLPGSTVDWGAKYTDHYVNALKPDLVILDFGMNDFWRLKPEEFKNYIETIMRKVRSANPKAEFLLIANMKFDPDYALDSDQYKLFYTDNLEGYSHVLSEMQKTGVLCVNMYAITDVLYKLKKAKDCLANPLHPNDYLARWFAQALSTSLIR